MTTRMEEQQEKTKQPKSTFSFPLDLISEILLRLPWKSVVRFRCVSKLWSSIATDPYFANSFETRSSARPSLLLCFREEEKMFVFSTPQRHENWNERYSSSLPIDPKSRFSPTESVRGLICFDQSARVIVWNPSTTQFLTLPELVEESWKRVTVFLGYDPMEGKHKVVCVPCGITSDHCRVFTLGSAQESWRWIKTNYIHQSGFGKYGRCINGVVYYLAYIDQTDVRFIMSFDVRSEKVNKIVLPFNIHTDVLLLAYDGKLACLALNNNNLSCDIGITLWILEDAEKHKWSSKDFPAPFNHYDPSSGKTATLNGITHGGEFIYAPLGFCGSSFFTLFYDPVKNSFRKVEFTVDDKFLLSHGVPTGHLYVLHAFANHIDNLMSF